MRGKVSAQGRVYMLSEELLGLMPFGCAKSDMGSDYTAGLPLEKDGGVKLFWNGLLAGVAGRGDSYLNSAAFIG